MRWRSLSGRRIACRDARRSEERKPQNWFSAVWCNTLSKTTCLRDWESCRVRWQKPPVHIALLQASGQESDKCRYMKHKKCAARFTSSALVIHHKQIPILALRFIQSRNARKGFTFEQFQASAAASGNVAHLVC